MTIDELTKIIAYLKAILVVLVKYNTASRFEGHHRGWYLAVGKLLEYANAEMNELQNPPMPPPTGL